MNKHLHRLMEDAIDLLKDLIATQSFSREEDKTAAIIEKFLQVKKVETKRYLNNVWSVSKHFDKEKPVLLLNSHHDTVQPDLQYTNNPFFPILKKANCTA